MSQPHAPPSLKAEDRVEHALKHAKYGRVLRVYGRRAVVRWDNGKVEDITLVQVFACPTEAEIEQEKPELQRLHMARKRAEKDT